MRGQSKQEEEKGRGCATHIYTPNFVDLNKKLYIITN